jgi:PGF-pre-PGF domain-containing protein
MNSSLVLFSLLTTLSIFSITFFSFFFLSSLIFAAPITETENQTINVGSGLNASVGLNGSVTTTTTTTTTTTASVTVVGGNFGTRTDISGGGGAPLATTTTTAAPVVETKKIGSVAAGSSYLLNVTKANDLKVDQIKIDVKNAVSNVEIQIKESSAPTGNFAISSALGLAYKYLEITKTNITDSDISSVTIKFKVEKSWFITNGIDVSTITLKRLVGTTWTELPTIKTSEDVTYIYFEATSPGLSIFAVTGEKIITTTTTTLPATTTTTQITPPVLVGKEIYIVLAIIAVVFVVAALFWKMRKKII